MAVVANWLTHQIVALASGGSIPLDRPIICGSSSVVEYNLAKVGVAGSNPVFRSTADVAQG